MSNVEKTSNSWRVSRAYALSVLCLVIGLGQRMVHPRSQSPADCLWRQRLRPHRRTMPAWVGRRRNNSAIWPTSKRPAARRAAKRSS